MPLITVCALFVLLLRVIANSSLGLIYELHFPAGVYVESSPCRVWDCPWSQASAGAWKQPLQITGSLCSHV